MLDHFIAFDSTQQALRTEMLLEYADIEIDTLPTPKEITAGCALTIAFEQQEFQNVVTIIKEQNVEIKGIYQLLDGQYIHISI